MGFYFIVIAPLLLSCCGFFFVFECEVFFFGGFQCSVNGCSTASCNFGALAGGDEHTSFYSAILNQKSDEVVFKITSNFKFYFERVYY